MPKYKVKLKFVTEGHAIVIADSAAKAKKLADESVWAMTGTTGVQPGMDDEVIDYEIDMHMETKAVGKVRKIPKPQKKKA